MDIDLISLVNNYGRLPVAKEYKIPIIARTSKI